MELGLVVYVPSQQLQMGRGRSGGDGRQPLRVRRRGNNSEKLGGWEGMCKTYINIMIRWKYMCIYDDVNHCVPAASVGIETHLFLNIRDKANDIAGLFLLFRIGPPNLSHAFITSERAPAAYEGTEKELHMYKIVLGLISR